MYVYRVVLFVFGVALFLFSSFWSAVISKDITKWPASSDTTYILEHNENNRFKIDSEWEGNQLSNSQISIVSKEIDSQTATIQKEFKVISIDGEILFNLSQSFKIDRQTRHNLPSDTDQNGVAYSSFPPGVSKTDYLWWPPTFGSPINMQFIGEELIQGLRIYHFQSQLSYIDDTSGYEFLPLVPEEYKVASTATIDVFIEPITGLMVNYKDRGVSYYSSESVKRVWDISQWSNQYSEEMITEAIKEAKQQVNFYSLHQNIIPGIIFLLGIFFIFYSVKILKKK